MRSIVPLVVSCALAACSTAAPPAPPKDSTMMANSNEQLVRRLYDEYINLGRLDRLAEIVSPDFVGPAGRGPAAFASSIGALRAGFPDLSYTVDEIVAASDRVAVRWTVRGTHTGAFRTFAPTGKKIENKGFAIFHITDSKLVSATVDTDRLGFLLQIGAIPYDPAFGPPPPPAR